MRRGGRGRGGVSRSGGGGRADEFGESPSEEVGAVRRGGRGRGGGQVRGRGAEVVGRCGGGRGSVFVCSKRSRQKSSRESSPEDELLLVLSLLALLVQKYKH